MFYDHRAAKVIQEQLLRDAEVLTEDDLATMRQKPLVTRILESLTTRARSKVPEARPHVESSGFSKRRTIES